jgi:hypothetical protein
MTRKVAPLRDLIRCGCRSENVGICISSCSIKILGPEKMAMSHRGGTRVGWMYVAVKMAVRAQCS